MCLEDAKKEGTFSPKWKRSERGERMWSGWSYPSRSSFPRCPRCKQFQSTFTSHYFFSRSTRSPARSPTSHANATNPCPKSPGDSVPSFTFQRKACQLLEFELKGILRFRGFITASLAVRARSRLAAQNGLWKVCFFFLDYIFIIMLLKFCAGFFMIFLG